MVWEPEVEEIERRRQLALRMGGEERVRDQHARGKLTARERIAALVDAESWRERGVLCGSASYEGGTLKEFMPKRTIYGLARIDGRPVAVSADDFTARPGSGSAGEQGRQGGEGSMRGADQMALHFKVP